MIFQGAFESVSLAVYGDLVAEQPALPLHYRPNQLPVVEHARLTGSLDPANAKDPTLLARQLLELTPESPSLAIVVRLMYCVKPSDVDWENPDFPYLHVDLSQDIADFSLEKAVKLTTEQISDELTSDQLSHFADKISTIIGPPVCLPLLEGETISTSLALLGQRSVVSPFLSAIEPCFTKSRTDQAYSGMSTHPTVLL